MTDEFIFEFKAPISNLEYIPERESLKITGLVLRLGKFTRNGRRYQINEAGNFIKELKGTPLFYSADKRGLHIQTDKQYVGKVLETRKNGATLYGDVEVWNTPDYPNIVQQVQESWERGERWGLSLGGRAMVMIPTGKLNKNFRPMYDVKKMMPHHIQLLEPNAPRGDPDAQVLSIGESFEIYEAFDEEEFAEKVANMVWDKLQTKLEKENTEPEEKKEEKSPPVKTKKPKKRKVNIHLKGIGSGDEVNAKRKQN